MKRPIIIVGGVLVAVALIAGGGAYAYFFSGLRSAPTSLAATTATPSTAAAASATPASTTDSSLAGTWKVGGSSLAGFRVQEVFAGTTAAHEAVSRTSGVSGGLTVQSAASGLTASGLKFTAQLSSLKSVDTVAGRDVSNRDRIVQQNLNTSQYPTATFVADSVTLPASLASGGSATATVPGQLTIDGTTKTEQVTITQVSITGSQAEVKGSTSFAMTDFGIQVPQMPFVTVQPKVTLDFDLFLTKS